MRARAQSQRKITRRRLLGLGAAAAVALGSAAAVVRSRGYYVDADRAAKLVALLPWQLVVLDHAARRICAPDRDDGSMPSADDLDVGLFVDGWMARLAPRQRRDLARFLGYLEHVAPVGAGFVSRFTRLGASDQDAVLASIESASSDLLRAGFSGVKALVFVGYWRDARTWSAIGYDGPLAGRPAGGWK